MMRSILSVLFFAGAGAIFFLYTQPAYDSVQAIAAQNTQYDSALSKATELQQLKQSLLSKLNSFDSGNLSRLQTMLPDQVDNIRLILDLDNIASLHGMALQNVSISSPNPGAQGGAVGAISAGGSKYDSITMSFDTHGTYDQFKSFLQDLEDSLRIVDLVSLTLTPNNSTPGVVINGAQASYSYSLTMRTYWLR